MGGLVKHRKKYVSHKKRWDKKVIVDEAVLVNDYALKNKKEIRKVELEISKIKKIAKELNRSAQTKESETAKNFVEKLKNNGYLNSDATSLDEVLDIKLRNLLERRLTNIVYKAKLARTPVQARQFVVHRHITVNGKLVDSPSFMVPLTLEHTVSFVGNSTLADENHPERKLASGGIIEEIIEMEEKASIGKKSDVDKEAVLDDEEADEVKD